MANKSGNKTSPRNTKGQFAVTKGVADSSFGQAVGNSGVAPKVVSNFPKSLTPIEAFELTACVRTAIRGRNDPLKQVKIRVFTKSGKEVTQGDIVEKLAHPSEGQTGVELLHDIGCWSDLCDERVVWQNPKSGSIYALNPFSLRITNPVMPRFPEDIKRYQYTWHNGQVQDIPADEIHFEREWNPSSPVRGVSKLFSVLNAISSYYFSERFVRAFFANNMQPGNIINIETENPDIASTFKAEMESMHKGESNAFRSIFTYGSKVSIDQMSEPIADAPFQQLRDAVSSQVNSVYVTPPLISGTWDKTRFDSVEEQSDFFYGGVFLPDLEQKQSTIQRIVDKFFRFSSVKASKDMSLTKELKKQYEIGSASSTSDYVIILDASHILEVANLKKKRLDYAKSHMDTWHTTPRQTADELGVDVELDDRSADLVWFPSNVKFFEPLKAGAVPATPEAVAENQNNIAPKTPEKPEEEPTEEETEKKEKIKSFFRTLRKMSLEATEGKMWTLNEADALAKTSEVYSPEVYRAIRADYVVLSNLVKNKSKEEIKKHFTNKKSDFIKSLIKR